MSAQTFHQDNFQLELIHRGLRREEMGFGDASANFFYRVSGSDPESEENEKCLFDIFPWTGAQRSYKTNTRKKLMLNKATGRNIK